MRSRPSILRPGARAGLALVLGVLLGPADGARAADLAERLVWHVETVSGEPVDSRRGDEPINPASVVKVAVTLHALERFGPDHRFATRFATDAAPDPERGVLAGDLSVLGGGDPDFHPENAFLVAEALNALGVRRVEGRLLAGDGFWIGWEGGSARPAASDEERAVRMADRLREAWDPEVWRQGTRNIWRELNERRGTPEREPARVLVEGGSGRHEGTGPATVLVTHRSNPLPRTLKRLNAYSNNDIERLEASVGSPAEVAAALAARLDLPAGSLRFDTLSGLGTNRITPRAVVRLLRELRASSARLGLRVEDLLPVAGCDPGTLQRFPRLHEGRMFAGKTGTLTTTDGGVSVLAGYLSTAAGERLLCVALPRSGYGVRAARRAEERWLLELAERNGGPAARDCGPEVGHSDFDARVEAGADPRPLSRNAAPVPSPPEQP